MLLWPLRMSCTYSFWSFFVLTKKPLQRPNDSWHFTYHGHWNCFAWDKSLPFRHRFGIYVARARNFWVSFAFGNVHCSCCSVPACFSPVCTVFQILLQLITSFSLILFYRHTLRWALLVILPPTHVTTSQLAHTIPSLCVTLRLPRLLGLPCHEDYFHHHSDSRGEALDGELVPTTDRGRAACGTEQLMCAA